MTLRVCFFLVQALVIIQNTVPVHHLINQLTIMGLKGFTFVRSVACKMVGSK